MASDMTFDAWRQATVLRATQAIAAALPAETTEPVRLHESMRYAALAGGKRVRPLLCYAAGMLTGAAPEVLDAAAAAVELIHVYSLVHDDMPAMDNDPLRHGKPTVHVRYDEATALLVGDALQSQAFAILAQAPATAAARVALVRELAIASGSLGMAGGQAIDLESVGVKLDRAALENMHRMKTGALLRAAVRLGALCGMAETAVLNPQTELQAKAQNTPPEALMRGLDQYAAAIGLAFQVVDDILDVTSDSATLGKTAGKDGRDDKPTYVSLLGLDASRTLAFQLREQAHAALASVGGDVQRLAQLADLVVDRAH